MDLRNLNDAEQFQRVFVTPMVEAVRAEIKPLVEARKDHEERLHKVERNQRRALAGLAVFSVALGIAIDWIKRKLGL